MQDYAIIRCERDLFVVVCARSEIVLATTKFEEVASLLRDEVNSLSTEPHAEYEPAFAA